MHKQLIKTLRLVLGKQIVATRNIVATKKVVGIRLPKKTLGKMKEGLDKVEKELWEKVFGPY